MALVLPFALLRPIHPRGSVSLLASQLRAPGAVASGSRLWLPSDLGTKLKLWLKGDDLTGSNGSNVASWTDASGNSNDATPVTAHPTLVTAGLNGLNTVGFNSASSQYFTLPTGLLSGRTQSASFAVYKLTNSPPSAANSGGAVFGDFGSDALGNHDPYTDGNFYEDYCTNTRRTVSGVTASTAFRILGLRSQTNDWRLDINGTNQFTDATNTFATNSAPLLGYTSAGVALDGQIAEVVDCSDFLATAEKEQVEGYLAWKWGIQASLPGGHTYASAAPTVGSSSGTTYNDTLSESLAAADSIIGAAVFTASFSEGLTGSDSNTGTATFTASLSQSVTGSDSLTGSATLTGSIAETLTASDSPTATLTANATLSEGLTANYTLTGGLLLTGTISESLTASDNIIGSAIFAAPITESLAGSDGLTAAAVYIASLVETASVTDGYVLDLTTAPTTPPYVPPTIFYGFHNHRPTTVSWGPDSSSGAVWRRNNKDPSKWS